MFYPYKRMNILSLEECEFVIIKKEKVENPLSCKWLHMVITIQKNCFELLHLNNFTYSLFTYGRDIV